MARVVTRTVPNRYYCTPRVGESGFFASSWTELVAGIVGPEYLETTDPIERDMYREDYCLAKLVLFPDAALDPRTEEAFCRTLAAAGIIGLWEIPL
jgi:hypothetical protein